MSSESFSWDRVAGGVVGGRTMLTNYNNSKRSIK